jgi:peptidyl-prolyl cis-trans isomerase SurA
MRFEIEMAKGKVPAARNLAFLFTFMASILVAPSSYGNDDVQGIAAIVNDEIISKYDLRQRMNLIVFSSGGDRNPADLERMESQVQRTLVDETLKIQEANRLEVNVSSAEVDQAIAEMSQQNNMTVEQITELLTSNGTNMFTLRRQIAADIAWESIVRGMFGSRVSITNDEIESVFNQNLESANQPQYWVSEIYLPVDSPEKDAEIKSAANDLISQLQRGSQFPALARQMSQSASASQGGDIGWIREGQLAPELNQALRTMKVGDISQPIRTVNAYYVLALRNRREVGGADPMDSEITMQRIVVPIDPSAPQEEIQDAGNYLYQATKGVKSCPQLAAVHRELGAGQLTEVAKIIAKNLPDAFRSTVLPMEVGETSPPLLTQQGFQILTVCDRDKAVARLPSRDEIRSRLFNQQLSMLARRHIRDLRNDAIVEYR